MKKRILIAALAVLLGANIPAVRVLSISNRKNLSEKVFSAAATTRGFTISYTHSVNKGRVHDFYRALPGGELELYMTEFVSYGAGIPEAGETDGARFRSTESGFIIEDLHRVLPRLVMAVGVVAEHSLSYPDSGEEFFLREFFKPQTSLVFEVRRVPLTEYLLTKRI